MNFIVGIRQLIPFEVSSKGFADVWVGETGADVVGAIIVCDGSGRSFAISKHADVLHVKHQRHAEQILLTQEKGVKDYNPMVCYAVSSGCLYDVIERRLRESCERVRTTVRSGRNVSGRTCALSDVQWISE